MMSSLVESSRGRKGTHGPDHQRTNELSCVLNRIHLGFIDTKLNHLQLFRRSTTCIEAKRLWGEENGALEQLTVIPTKIVVASIRFYQGLQKSSMPKGLSTHLALCNSNFQG